MKLIGSENVVKLGLFTFELMVANLKTMTRLEPISKK